MASNPCLVLALVLAATVLGAHAGDPDITWDYISPRGVTPDADFFTFKGLKKTLWSTPEAYSFNVAMASQDEFSALTGQSVSFAVLQFGAGGLNPPHTHPRSSEILLVLHGCLEVGLVDSSNKLFTQTLETGDVFMFPKGLVHYVMNRDLKYPAVAVAAFGSADAGLVDLPMALFGSRIINKEVLAESFKTDAHTIDLLSWVTTQGHRQ